MTLDKFTKLANGTREDFMIACNWLVTNHDPVEYILEYGNIKLKSNGLTYCNRSISWTGDWRGNLSENNLYYKYKEERYILRCDHGITVTDKNYDSRAEVIIH